MNSTQHETKETLHRLWRKAATLCQAAAHNFQSAVYAHPDTAAAFAATAAITVLSAPFLAMNITLGLAIAGSIGSTMLAFREPTETRRRALAATAAYAVIAPCVLWGMTEKDSIDRTPTQDMRNIVQWACAEEITSRTVEINKAHIKYGFTIKPDAETPHQQVVADMTTPSKTFFTGQPIMRTIPYIIPLGPPRHPGSGCTPIIPSYTIGN